MKATTKKSWSVRVIRWLELLPWEIKEADMTKKPAREKLKKWIKHVISVRGDRILWGQPLTGDQRRMRARDDQGPHDQGGGGGTEEGQMNKNGEAENAGLPCPVTAVNSTSPCDSRETVTIENIAKDMLQERVNYWLGQDRRNLQRKNGRRVKKGSLGMKPGGLPCSWAAVVLTSPQGSRGTKTTMAYQPGEQGDVDSDAARKSPQAQLQEGEAGLSRMIAGGQYCLCGRRRRCDSVLIGQFFSWDLVQERTEQSLGWRKGVG